MTRSRVKNDFAVGIDDNATSTAITIDSSENVGINTVSASGPQSTFHIEQNGDDADGGFRLSRDNALASYTQYINTSSVWNLAYGNPSSDDSPTNILSVSTNGDVGIGKNPAQKLDVNGQVLATTFKIPNSQSIKALQADGTEDNMLYYSHLDQLFVGRDNTHVKLRTDGQIRLTVDSDGIKFNNDTAAANALDDYEEGTWTPVLRTSNSDGTYSMSVQGAYYTRIGRVVYYQCYAHSISCTAQGTGNMQIGGLPFTGASAGNSYSGGNSQYGNMRAKTRTHINSPNGGSYLRLMNNSGSTNADYDATAASFGTFSGLSWIFSGFYIAN